MAVDTPARIAILGAGPIGLEAALYARYLGYDIDLYERGRIAEHLLRWGELRLFAPWSAIGSPLGTAAIAAQDPNWKPPAPDDLLTAGELAERYYIPLSQTDLLIDNLHAQTEVLSVGRGDLLKGELSGEQRAEADFRLLLRAGDAARKLSGERIAAADVVIDATGVYGEHNWLGVGGIPALGELAAAPRIEYGLPDVLGRDREQYAHRHTLVVGAGHSAASAVTALARLGHEAPYTRITWVVRRPIGAGAGPIRRIENDPWPQRDQLARSANQLLQGEIGHLTFCPGTTIEQVVGQNDGEPFRVRLAGLHAGEIEVDRIIANVGYHPNHQIYAELQVADDPTTDAPTRWFAERDPQSLVTAEPDFYVLGAKSVGRQSQFSIADGLLQIRQLFTIIGDRPGLNLYEGSLA